MKKSVLSVLCLVIGMLFATSPAFATSKANAGNNITGSEHDLSSSGAGAAYGDVTGDQLAGADGGNRICVYCHAPHHTVKPGSADAKGVAYLPLWNHEVTGADYMMYSNGTELPNDLSHKSQAMILIGGNTKPGSVSRLCLSCHDGTVATNSYGFAPSPGRSIGVGDKYVLAASEYFIGGDKADGRGNDLANHHPIGFDYAAAKADDDELAATAAMMGTYEIGELLWQGKMECTTCHDVHNSKNTGERFLWISDTGSAFCKTCHLK